MSTANSETNIIQEINIPVPEPSYFSSFSKLISISVETAKNTINKISGWVSPYIPKMVKDRINNVYEKLVNRSSHGKRSITKSAPQEKKSTTKSARFGRDLRPREHKSALRGFLKTYRIDGDNDRDAVLFLNMIQQPVIDFLLQLKKTIKLRLILTCEFFKEQPDKTIDYNFGYFHSETEIITRATDIDKLFEKVVNFFLERISQFTNDGSGWKFNKVEFFDIHTDPFTPIKAKKYFLLPEVLIKKKAIINIKNIDDNECFKWAVTCAIYSKDFHPERLNKKIIENSKKFNWADIDFPVSLSAIDKFEKQNPFAINVFGLEENVYPLRISKQKAVPVIRLLLLENGEDNHCCWIKNFSRLCSSQANMNKHKLYFCDRCINSFLSNDSLEKHIEYCSAHDSVQIVMPEKGTFLKFKNLYKSMRHPFVIYADFECFLEKIDTCAPYSKKSYTKQYQKHLPSGFCIKPVCAGSIDYDQEPIIYSKESKNDDVIEACIEAVEEGIKKFYNRFKFPKKDEIQSVRKETVRRCGLLSYL